MYTIIIGGGPAGLTAALELARKGRHHIVIIEQESRLGGISRTLNYKGNCIDIGGHRFFSKSDTVMDWWKNILPLQGAPSCDDLQLRRAVDLSAGGPDPESEDRVMLVRRRLSRILFLRQFFEYPVTLSLSLVYRLGLRRMMRIAVSYFVSLIFKRRENSLEDFFINRFGSELYKTFFRDYTAKVWGVPCSQIGADWGAQRVKGLSVTKVVLHALKKLCFWRKSTDLDGETSLIGAFWYPKFGPGQLWEAVGAEAEKLGVTILRKHRVCRMMLGDGGIAAVETENLETGERMRWKTAHVISSTSVKELVAMTEGDVPEQVSRVAKGLVYRDFMTVGVLLDRLKLKSRNMNTSVGKEGIIPDNWIYVQEPDVRVGRLQIFNNWSPYLLADKGKVWIGMEYFVNEGDELWRMSDASFCSFAIEELVKMNVIDRSAVRDSKLFRIRKAYPAYFGTYNEFHVIQKWTDSLSNLYLVGRNGMHRYNNMDHSMLSAMEAVKVIVGESADKRRIWEVNTEKTYHEAQ